MKMTAWIKKILAAIIVFGPLLAGGSAHAQTQASDVVSSFYAQLSDTIKQGDQLGFSGRYKKLAPAIRSSFNLPLMAKMSVGTSWNNASAQEQSELVNAFTDFSIATYASRFATDDGEKFAIVAEHPAENGVIVETTMTPKEGDVVTLNYLMRPDSKGDYRIVDVYINGTISELATQRAEFSSIARRDGIMALVNSLDAKSKQMGPS